MTRHVLKVLQQTRRAREPLELQKKGRHISLLALSKYKMPSHGTACCKHSSAMCVLILLYMCPHAPIYVLILLYMCPHTPIICVLILLYMCPHIPIYVSHTPIYVSI